MDWITKENSSNPMANQSGKSMPVWFMPMVFGIALLVTVLVALVMCIRWRQLRSSTDATKEGEQDYEEISARKASRQRKRNTDKDDYETIPVMSRKTPKTSNKNTDGEYKMLTTVRPQQEYASLNKATCSSKTSLSSLTSGCEVKEDRSKNRTKRQGLIIPSLSNPREETADRICVSQARSVDDIATHRTKPAKQVKVNKLTSQLGATIASGNVTRSASMRPQPVTHQRQKKNVRKIEYENATVVIHDGDKTETRRIALEKN